MRLHAHNWIRTGGNKENPGVWDQNGAIVTTEACTCGATRKTSKSYCGRSHQDYRIITYADGRKLNVRMA
jgi:hypothetical protein